MIEIDYRIGSEHLLPILGKMMLPTRLVELAFGDVAFNINGPKGPLSVGVELKRIRDLVNSIRDGRLAGHQLPGMTQHYGVTVLMVEGLYQPSSHGRLQIFRGGWVDLTQPSVMYAEVDNFITTLQMVMNIRFKRTGSPTESAHAIANMYRWGQKAWTDHNAHTQFDQPEFVGTLPLKPLGVVERACHAILPGFGIKRAIAAARKFPSVFHMAMSDVNDWTSIEGVGGKLASDMVKSINGEYDARRKDKR